MELQVLNVLSERDFDKMSGYNWTWPQIPSLTAMKYQRHGYVQRRPFEIGERFGLVMISFLIKRLFV